MITCDEVIEPYVEEIKANPTNFSEKKYNLQLIKHCILIAFLLITIALLIAVSIYGYLIKYWEKQKHLLPFHDTNEELRKVLY